MLAVDRLGEEEAEIIKFKQEVERRKLLTVREIELQSLVLILGFDLVLSNKRIPYIKVG